MYTRRDWAGVCAAILSAGLVTGWALALVLASTPWTETLNGPAADLLSGIGQVLAGALATFLGTRATRDRSTVDAEN
jgi:hypothetical protein